MYIWYEKGEEESREGFKKKKSQLEVVKEKGNTTKSLINHEIKV